MNPLSEHLAQRSLPAYESIVLATDSSDHANRATSEAVGLAAQWGAQLTGIHVYAAKLHDLRFRQMEGGLPEQFREERELERQRDVHDSLISRGLSIISDSYLDQVRQTCEERGVRFAQRAPEGKNYRGLIAEANNGSHDLLVIGALGLGTVQGSRLGSVAIRVARRAAIDTLVIRNPRRSISEGPLVVAMDGSPRAYGALRTALALAVRWRVAVKAVAAFDPYYHYVAFNRIATVLSEQAGKVFRFREQEKLHEEIIDSGLAKIYQGHLRVAVAIAAEHGIELETELLDGKPHEAIERYLERVNPSLLIAGRTGIHADADLDIGGNAENLLRNANCAVLLGAREYQPPAERMAAETTSWTHEAQAQMERVPAFARDMARMAILRYAQERGHTVITARIADEATASLCPHATRALQQIVEWSEEASELLGSVADPALQESVRLRAAKKARQSGALAVAPEHVRDFIGAAAPPPRWTEESLRRLERIPDTVRGVAKEEIERCAQEMGLDTVTPEAFSRARGAMARLG